MTKHGRETVVVVEIGEFRRLSERFNDGLTFKEFLLSIPTTDDLVIERSKDLPREIDLS